MDNCGGIPYPKTWSTASNSSVKLGQYRFVTWSLSRKISSNRYGITKNFPTILSSGKITEWGACEAANTPIYQTFVSIFCRYHLHAERFKVSLLLCKFIWNFTKVCYKLFFVNFTKVCMECKLADPPYSSDFPHGISWRHICTQQCFFLWNRRGKKEKKKRRKSLKMATLCFSVRMDYKVWLLVHTSWNTSAIQNEAGLLILNEQSRWLVRRSRSPRSTRSVGQLAKCIHRNNLTVSRTLMRYFVGETSEFATQAMGSIWNCDQWASVFTECVPMGVRVHRMCTRKLFK